MEYKSFTPLSLFNILLSLSILNILTILKEVSSTIHFIIQLSLFYLPTTWTPKNDSFNAPLIQREKLYRKNGIQDVNKRIPGKPNGEKIVNPENIVEVSSSCSIEEVRSMMEELDSSVDVVERFDVLFEEEPSLEEVKEAFCVFDENKDGFIDADELRKVLCRLGFLEVLSEMDCVKMISVFDDDRDGKIDFYEFSRLLEKSFS